MLAEQCQLDTTSDTHLGDTLHYLRKTAKISQEEMGKLLGVHQTAVCRIEKGVQSLTPEQLFILSKHFDLKLDYLLAGKINFWRVAERFGRKPLLPKRYSELAFSKSREVLPLLTFITNTKGTKYTTELLQSFGLKDIFFKDPDTNIGVHLGLDLFTHSVKNKILNDKTFESLIDCTRLPEVQGFLHPIYQTQKTSVALIQTWTLNSHHYDTNFKYEIDEIDAKHIRISISPQSHMSKVDYRSETLGTTVCQYKQEYFKQLPKYISAAPLKLREKECQYKGSHKCTYELSVS